MQVYLLGKSLQASNVFKEFVLQVLCLIETLQFAEGVVGSSLNVLQVHILGETLEDESQTLGELASLLCIEPASFTRVVDRMVKQGLVTKKQSKSDGRRFSLSPTAAGKKAYSEFNDKAKARYVKSFEYLSKRDAKHFAKTLLQISENYGYQLPEMRPQDTELRFSLRCAARSLGSIWGGFIGSKYTSNEATLLMILWLTLDGLSISYIRDRYGIEASTLTRRIEKFEKRGLIQRTTDRNDKRKRKVKLTAKGEKEFERFLSDSAANLEGSNKKLGRTDLRQLVALLARVNEAVIKESHRLQRGDTSIGDERVTSGSPQTNKTQLELLIDGAFAGSIELSKIANSDSFRITGGSINLSGYSESADGLACKLVRK